MISSQSKDYFVAWNQFSSVQDGVFTLAKAHNYAFHPISEVSPTLPLKQFQCPTHKRLKRTLILIGQHKTRAHFQGTPFYKQHTDKRYTLLQTTHRQINEDIWKLYTYPVSVNGAGLIDIYLVLWLFILSSYIYLPDTVGNDWLEILAWVSGVGERDFHNVHFMCTKEIINCRYRYDYNSPVIFMGELCPYAGCCQDVRRHCDSAVDGVCWQSQVWSRPMSMGQHAWLLSLDAAIFAERAARSSAPPPSLILNGLSQQDPVSWGVFSHGVCCVDCNPRRSDHISSRECSY